MGCNSLMLTSLSHGAPYFHKNNLWQLSHSGNMKIRCLSSQNNTT